MVIVKTKSELISAIKNGETDIVVANPTLAKACCLVEENSYSQEFTNERSFAKATLRLPKSPKFAVSRILFDAVDGLSSVFRAFIGNPLSKSDTSFHKARMTETEDNSIHSISMDISKALKGKTIKIKQQKGKFMVKIN